MNSERLMQQRDASDEPITWTVIQMQALVFGSFKLMGKMKNEVLSFQLNTGALMPAIAMSFPGTVRETPEEIKARLRKSLEISDSIDAKLRVDAIALPHPDIGYRHIDTAAAYRKEHLLGEVLHEVLSSGAYKREELFITSKLHPQDTHPDGVVSALKRSLSELQLDYVDMYLIHCPLHLKEGTGIPFTEEAFLPLDLVGVWRVLEKCVELGLTKAIGVSNFGPRQLKLITSDLKIKTVPAVNQIEMHPGCLQPKLLDICRIMGTVVTASLPLGAPGLKGGSNSIIDSPIIQEIAVKHNKTVSQVALRWCLDQGAAVVTHTTSPARMAQNLDIFRWTLDKEDLEKIKLMPRFRLIDITPWCNSSTSPYRSPGEIFEEWYGNPDDEQNEPSDKM